MLKLMIIYFLYEENSSLLYCSINQRNRNWFHELLDCQVKGMINVLNEVSGAFQSNRESNEVVCHSEGLPFFRGQCDVTHLCTVDVQKAPISYIPVTYTLQPKQIIMKNALRNCDKTNVSTQWRSTFDQWNRLQELGCLFVSSFNVESNHPWMSWLLSKGQFMLRMGLEAYKQSNEAYD